VAYTPKDWTLDDPITAADLDNIETGIDDAHTAIDALPTTQGDTGSVSSVTHGNVKSLAVTFDVPFTEAPTVVACAVTSAPDTRRVSIGSVTTIGFTLYAYNTSGSTVNVGFSWLATGPT